MRKKEILKSPIFNSDIFPNPIDIHVGQKLRERRMRMGLSQEKLAEATNVTFQQVQKYETAKNRISASRLYQFAILLGVPVDYFFEGFAIEDVPATKSDDKKGLSDNKQATFSMQGSNDHVDNDRLKEERRLLKVYFSEEDPKRRKDYLKALTHLTKAK
ncbi:MAG: helix-turn-helix domain-containing protein [Pseudobdellovibrionaceae bacterium]